MTSTSPRPLPQSAIAAAKVRNINSGRKTSAVDRQVPKEAQSMSHEDVRDTIAAVMIDPQDVANRKAAAAEEQRLKDEAMEVKLENERHKDLQDAQDRGEKAASLFEKAITLEQDLVRLQFDFKKAAPQEREAIRGKALAKYVLLAETIAQIMQPIKASKSSATGRMKGVWEFESVGLTSLLKERQKPKVQFELELGTKRSELDSWHILCEKYGAPRMHSNERDEDEEEEDDAGTAVHRRRSR